MNKLLIASLMAASLLAACGKDDEAAKSEAATPTAPAAEVKKDVAKTAEQPKADQVAPTVVAPKPPPPPGGGKAAPELKPEDIARIQEMLKKQAAEASKPAAAPAAAPAKK